VSYTVDTISELKKQYEEDCEIFFIMGWDSLEKFADWREPGRIIDMCCIVAVPRPGCGRPDLERLEAKVPGIATRVVLTDGPLVDISSTSIRDTVSRGQSIDHLVPAAVAEYIQEHHLYLK
jgi:nicotinate-nucleotide adenylyltransferase